MACEVLCLRVSDRIWLLIHFNEERHVDFLLWTLIKISRRSMSSQSECGGGTGSTVCSYCRLTAGDIIQSAETMLIKCLKTSCYTWNETQKWQRRKWRVTVCVQKRFRKMPQCYFKNKKRVAWLIFINNCKTSHLVFLLLLSLCVFSWSQDMVSLA